MKKLSTCRALFVVVALFMSSVLHAQTLWTKSEYGMTVEQVKAAFPEAVAPVTIDHLYGGAANLLVMPGIEIAGSTFKANFFFLSEKLIQVTLSLESPGQFGTVMVSFKSVEEVLRAKYGNEIQRDFSGGTYQHANETWLSGPTNITLSASGVGLNPASLNIIYQVRVSKETEKL
jgi:hypothetical protein